jgi:hypothetical protein
MPRSVSQQAATVFGIIHEPVFIKYVLTNFTFIVLLTGSGMCASAPNIAFCALIRVLDETETGLAGLASVERIPEPIPPPAVTEVHP